VSKEKKKQAKEDQRIRNAICQKVWGLRKRRFGLNRIMTKLDNTSQTAIAITFLVMNLVVLFCKGQRKTIALVMQSPFFF
jgi:hypothetical protein